MYTLICDRCGKDLCESDFTGWNNESYVLDMASEEGWIKHEGEDICDDCYAYNDNDELEINDKVIKIKIIE